MSGIKDLRTGRRAVVAGGGIGGLAAAIALHRTGWDPVVLERSEVPADAGSGISLWPNALRVLDRLDVGAHVRALSAPLADDGGLRLPSGAWVKRSSGSAQLVEVAILHRAELYRVLRETLPPDCLRTGTEVTGVTDESIGPAWVNYLDGGMPQQLEAELVVAADGLNSRLRQIVWPQVPAPRYSGYTSWRGVTPSGAVAVTGGGETWGRGVKFGHIPLTRERVYWYLALNTPPGRRYADERAEVRRHVASWHAPIPALVDATPADRVLHLDIWWLPRLPTYVCGRVALLGDAAHAMTPDLGQGACQAIEDGYVLAVCLAASRGSVPAALARYDAERRPRSQAIAAAARRMGRFGQLEGRVPVSLRNAVLRMTPARLALRPISRISAWMPPDLPDPPGRPGPPASG